MRVKELTISKAEGFDPLPPRGYGEPLGTRLYRETVETGRDVGSNMQRIEKSNYVCKYEFIPKSSLLEIRT